MALTHRQAAFVREYLIDLNATKAAGRAGFSTRGHHKGADIANELMNRPAVRAAIEQALAERAERTRIDADWLLMRLADEAEADIADLYDDAGNIKPVREWPAVWRKGLVAGFEVEELFEGRGEDRKHIGRLRKVRLADRTKIKELIGRHVNIGAFKDRVEHTGKDGGPIAHQFRTVEEFEAVARKVASEI
jgi:phage terminase small subunit